MPPPTQHPETNNICYRILSVSVRVFNTALRVLIFTYKVWESRNVLNTKLRVLIYGSPSINTCNQSSIQHYEY